LDLPDSVLEQLDVVVGAGQSVAYQENRAYPARDAAPSFHVAGTSDGALVIQRREPYDVDMLRIIREAKKRGFFLELNAHPDRLDLLDT
jgi:DNA polymerase (family 10)